LIGAVAIGWAPILVRWSPVGSTATAFWRLALALPCWALLLGWTARRARRRRPTPRRIGPGLAWAGIFFAADLALWHASIRRTSVAHATLLANLSPIFVALGAYLRWGERFRRSFYLGLGLAVAGTFTLLHTSAAEGGERLGGDLLGVATAIAYGAYLLTVNRLRQRWTTPHVMTAVVFAAALVLGPLAIATESNWLPATAAAFAPLVALALVAQVAGQGLIAYALAQLPASFGAVALLVQPVVAALLAWHWFGEALGAIQALGALTVLAGVDLARRASRADAEREC
jgi:drug/metabolite transporter (DMT)-like permease